MVILAENYYQAIREINQRIIINKVNYILDYDIKEFFDNVDKRIVNEASRV